MKDLEKENKELKSKIRRAVEVLDLIKLAAKENRGLPFILGIINDAREILDEDK